MRAAAGRPRDYVSITRVRGGRARNRRAARSKGRAQRGQAVVNVSPSVVRGVDFSRGRPALLGQVLVQVRAGHLRVELRVPRVEVDVRHLQLHKSGPFSKGLDLVQKRFRREIFFNGLQLVQHAAELLAVSFSIKRFFSQF